LKLALNQVLQRLSPELQVFLSITMLQVEQLPTLQRLQLILSLFFLTLLCLLFIVFILE
jgi:hypothetical protein